MTDNQLAEMFTTYLGKAVDDPEIVALWKALDAKPPRFPAGEDDAFVVLEGRGLVLVVLRDSTRRSLTPQLGGIELHRQFTGALPEGLRFGDSRAHVHEKLGQAQDDIWTRDDHELVITFDERDKIETVYLYLPGFANGTLDLK